MILDNCDEDKPLLIHENSNVRGLPEAIRSLMLVPLNIRKKVFGVLAVSSLNGDVRFSEKDLYYMSFMTNKAAYAIENIALYENIYENLLATLYAFVGAIEARDPYTEQHSNRVTRIAIALCRAMGGSQEEQDILNVAGQLHDIGKIGIRDDILLKPGRLTDEEFRIIKEHPVIGANIVERLGLWDREKNIIKCHHERFDGKGLPRRPGRRKHPHAGPDPLRCRRIRCHRLRSCLPQTDGGDQDPRDHVWRLRHPVRCRRHRYFPIALRPGRSQSRSTNPTP